MDGARPFCTGDGVGAVLSVIGPRDARGNVVHPTRVVSVNEPCETTQTPFLNTYEGVRVECAEVRRGLQHRPDRADPRQRAGRPRRCRPTRSPPAAAAWTPHISVAYADLQVNRVAKARGVSPDQVGTPSRDNQDGRILGFIGEPRVNVLELNLELDEKYPAKS